MKKKEIRPRQPSRRQLQSQQFAAYSISEAPVVVHLSNGARLHGLVLAADDFVLLLGRRLDDDQPTVVYKRAICLVTPAGAPDEVAVAPETMAAPEFVPLYIPRTRKRR
ncbi:RNA chaperone Hfq [Cupriavidus nantongensis]|uniref:RNA chaperone Hfq n=1 Tax=Cupriavidus nantongensis TaxID=1796606 RepID=UPI002245FE5F|nr:RNA chaperone Hfq [Cupriavidus nantongensis]